MEDETQVEDTQIEDTTVENDNSSNIETEGQTDNSESNEDIPTVDDYNRLKAERDDLERKNKQLFQRTQKVQSKGQPQPLKNNNDLTREEVILIAKGLDEDSIVFLKTLQAGNKAMGRNVSLTDLQLDPSFVALSEKKSKDARSIKAGLGASGKGIQNTTETYVKDMPRDDHKKLWEESRNG